MKLVCSEVVGPNGRVMIYLTVRVVMNGVVICIRELALLREWTFSVMKVMIYSRLRTVVV